jgi:hypothetical protein
MAMGTIHIEIFNEGWPCIVVHFVWFTECYSRERSSPLPLPVGPKQNSDNVTWIGSDWKIVEAHYGIQ